MSKFKLKAVQVAIVTTSDGKEFTDMAEAEQHQFALENKELIASLTESYLNKRGLIDRNRQQKLGVAADVVGFIIESGIDLSSCPAVERTVQDSPKVEAVAKDDAATGDETDTKADASAESADEETKELF